MDLKSAVEIFGPIAGPTLIFLVLGFGLFDRMTKGKLDHVAAGDRVDEASIGITKEAMKQTGLLQERLFTEIDMARREQIADREVLKAFGDELKLATETLLTAVKRVESVLVFVGDMDMRSGAYFKSIMDGIEDLKAVKTSRKDES